MGKNRPHEVLNGSQPWIEMGVCKATYYNKRKKEWERENKRASGKIYSNSAEKINAIKEKYKNGVTAEILAELF
jgi:hypothetical protein